MIKLSIIIPVYNEKDTVLTIIDQVYKVNLGKIKKDIIVIDDGSTDGTSQLLQSLQKKRKFQLFRHKINKGKGAAVKSGLKRAKGEIILIQDADLEYRVDEYLKVLKPILSQKFQFVLGSRHLTLGKWKYRKFLTAQWYARLLNLGGVLYTKLFNILYGVDLTDPATMYKVFKRECLDGIELRSNHFELDWELVAKLIKKGYIPKEVPISYRSRSPEEGKKIRFLQDGIEVIWAIVKFRFTD